MTNGETLVAVVLLTAVIAFLWVNIRNPDS